MLTFIVGVAGCAANIGFYISEGDAWSLAAAIFCGAVGIGGLVQDVTR